MSLTEGIRAKAGELLESGVVECVIGYERGTDGVNARPAFVYSTDEVDRLIFDDTCSHNLVKYLLNRKGKTTAVVAKPCDARGVNLLLNEHQIEREKVHVIGVVCPGVVDSAWGSKGDKLRAVCEVCRQHVPPVYDHLVGDVPASEPEVPEPYADIEKMEGMSVAERAAFWEAEFSRCIRCYACRQACPGCYCVECFVERLHPLWVGIRIGPGENQMWNAMRAFHLAGRCIGCNQCEKVCPVNIPLSLLNRKLEKEAWELFHFRAGMAPDTAAPFATFEKDEKVGIGE